MNTGRLILLSSNKGIFPKLIKFFTKSKWTHNAIVIGDVLDVESILSAESLISVYPLKNYYEEEDYYFDVYEIINAEKELIKDILRDIYKSTASESYGYLQLLWHVYRWMAEGLGFSVTKQKNWFPSNDQCSEQTYRFIKQYAERKGYKDLVIYLNQFNENTFNPNDSYEMFLCFPEVFKKVEK